MQVGGLTECPGCQSGASGCLGKRRVGKRETDEKQPGRDTRATHVGNTPGTGRTPEPPKWLKRKLERTNPALGALAHSLDSFATEWGLVALACHGDKHAARKETAQTKN